MSRMARALAGVMAALAMAPLPAWAGPTSVLAPASRAEVASGAGSHDLRVRALPPPTSLRMRPPGSEACGPRDCGAPRVAAAEPAEAPLTGAPNANNDANGAKGARDARVRAPARAGRRRKDSMAARLDERERARLQEVKPSATQALAERVVFRFNLGMGFDGGEPDSEDRLLSGAELDSGTPMDPSDDVPYAKLRAYYFGDAVIGSRGIIAPSLTTYLATQFRYDQVVVDAGKTGPVPTVFDGDDVVDLWIRSAYGMSDGFFDNRLLKPIYVRAGRQYRYGPAIAHFDGLTLGYEGRAVSVGAFAGQSVNLTGLPLTGGDFGDSSISGLDVRIDFHALRRIPLVLTSGALTFAGHDHFETTLAVRWNQDIFLSASLRTLDGKQARARAQVRARISRVTTLNLELDSRSQADWMYDLIALAPAGNTGANNKLGYLRLGPTVPRLFFNARAGTVLLGNVDVQLHGGGSILRDEEKFPAHPHAPSYVIEGGGAIEVRLRRAIGLGLSLLYRNYERGDDPALDENVSQDPDPLNPTPYAVGEDSFVEGGTTLRFTQGARKFSAGAELYARYYHFQPSYDIAPDVIESWDLEPDVRGGARFNVEAWAGERLRLKAEYDVSTHLVLAPELRGMKSLRILAEGRF